jgi:hypothetical protein
MAFSTYLADKILGWVKGSAFPTQLSNVYVSVHSGDPGATGSGSDQTASIVGNANRPTVASSAFTAQGAASGGGREITNTGVVQISASASNGSGITLTYFGVWDAQTGGNFLASGTLTSSVQVENGDSVQFNTGAMAIRVV